MSTEISSVKAFFTSIQVHLSSVWLESCINWCKTETLGPNYTPKELQSKVYEQWLLLDLRDVEVPVLPPDLSIKLKYTLNGNFCLQMMQIVDISKPKLWQLQKIRNSNTLTRGTKQDSEVVGTAKRLLQITLSDGVQEVQAMEYHPVPCLSLNLTPGVKIRVMGPVVVRRGRLMLEQQNVKILGGEVEELLVSNAAENVLARSLKLPENPNPAIIEEKMLAVEKEEKNEGYVTNFKISKKPEVPPTPKIRETIEVTEEDELIMAQEFDKLMEAEASANKKRKTPDLFEDVDFDNDFESINRSSTSTQVCPQQTQKKLELSLDDDDFDNINVHWDNLERTVSNQSEVKLNILTIAKLLKMKDNISKGFFKIKAKFKSIEEKFTIDHGVFKLVIKVEDGSGDLILSVHADIIAVFVECSPQDVINLKRRVVENDKEAMEKMMKTLMKVRDKLLELDNVMVVQVEKDKTPVLTKIL